MFKYSNLLPGQVVDLKEEIALISPTDTPLSTMIMQLGRVVPATDITVTWMEKELNKLGATNLKVEGAEADQFSNSKKTQKSNLCQIMEVGTKVSGTVQALNPAGIEDAYVSEINDRMIELKVGTEYYFLNGVKAEESGATPRQMDGLMNLATQKASAGDLTEDLLIDGMEMMYNAGVNGDVYLFCNAKLKRAINNIAKQDASTIFLAEAGKNDYGILVQRIETDFGVINIVMNRHMKDGEMLLIDLNEVEIAELRPAFYEALPKTGDYFAGHVLQENTIKLLNSKAGVAFKGVTVASAVASSSTRKAK